MFAQAADAGPTSNQHCLNVLCLLTTAADAEWSAVEHLDWMFIVSDCNNKLPGVNNSHNRRLNNKNKQEYMYTRS